MKTIIGLLIIILCLVSCGQEGTLHIYEVEGKRQELDSLISLYYEKYPEYLPTSSWQEHITDINDRVYFLKFYFLFDVNKNQMLVYKFSTSNQFNYENDTLNKSRIGIYGVYKFSKKYQKNVFMQAQHLSEKEMNQIKNTFEDVFLKKLKVKYKLLDFWERNSDPSA